MPAGRPTVMTEAVLGKLEASFAVGASDKEACFYADINPDAMYEYQKKNPAFTERKEALKERPILLARQTVVRAIETDVNTAKWYLEKKKAVEFSTKTEVDVTSKGDKVAQPIDMDMVTQFMMMAKDQTKQ